MALWCNWTGPRLDWATVWTGPWLDWARVVPWKVLRGGMEGPTADGGRGTLPPVGCLSTARHRIAMRWPEPVELKREPGTDLIL